MPQHLAGNDDDHHNLAALDFYGSEEVSADQSSGHDFYGHDFYGGDEADGDDSGFGALDTGYDAVDTDAPAAAPESGTDLDALRSLTEDEDEEEEPPMFTVTNPPGTVSVSTLMDGRIHQIDLTGGVSRMTEAQLAEEIVVIAELARRKARAGQHAFILDRMAESKETSEEMGAEVRANLISFLDSSLRMPTPEDAAAAEAEVFAVRYADDDENE